MELKSKEDEDYKKIELEIGNNLGCALVILIIALLIFLLCLLE